LERSTEQCTQKHIFYKVYAFIFINSLLKYKLDFKKNLFYLNNSISLLKYKNNSWLLFEIFTKNKKINNKEDIYSLNYFKHIKIGFGHLTWYWLFKNIRNRRLFLNYKQFKNISIRSNFFQYELSISRFEKIYNTWLYNLNTFNNGIKKLFLSKQFVIHNKFYFLIKKLKFKKWRLEPKCDLIWNPKSSKKIYKNIPFIKKYIRKRKNYSKKYALSLIKFKKQNIVFDRKLHMNKRFGFLKKNYSNLIYSLEKIKNKIKKNNWKIKLSKIKYFNDLSSLLNRVNLLKSSRFVRLPNVKNFFSIKNNQNQKNLYTQFIYPKNSIEFSEPTSFEVTYPNKKNTINYERNTKKNKTPFNKISNGYLILKRLKNKFKKINKFKKECDIKYKVKIKSKQMLTNKKILKKNILYKNKVNYISLNINSNKLKIFHSFGLHKIKYKNKKINNNKKIYYCFWLRLKKSIKNSVNTYMQYVDNLRFKLNIVRFNQFLINILIKISLPFDSYTLHRISGISLFLKKKHKWIEKLNNRNQLNLKFINKRIKISKKIKNFLMKKKIKKNKKIHKFKKLNKYLSVEKKIEKNKKIFLKKILFLRKQQISWKKFRKKKSLENALWLKKKQAKTNEFANKFKKKYIQTRVFCTTGMLTPVIAIGGPLIVLKGSVILKYHHKISMWTGKKNYNYLSKKTLSNKKRIFMYNIFKKKIMTNQFFNSKIRIWKNFTKLLNHSKRLHYLQTLQFKKLFTSVQQKRYKKYFKNLYKIKVKKNINKKLQLFQKKKINKFVNWLFCKKSLRKLKKKINKRRIKKSEFLKKKFLKIKKSNWRYIMRKKQKYTRCFLFKLNKSFITRTTLKQFTYLTSLRDRSILTQTYKHNKTKDIIFKNNNISIKTVLTHNTLFIKPRIRSFLSIERKYKKKKWYRKYKFKKNKLRRLKNRHKLWNLKYRIKLKLFNRFIYKINLKKNTWLKLKYKNLFYKNKNRLIYKKKYTKYLTYFIFRNWRHKRKVWKGKQSKQVRLFSKLMRKNDSNTDFNVTLNNLYLKSKNQLKIHNQIVKKYQLIKNKKQLNKYLSKFYLKNNYLKMISILTLKNNYIKKYICPLKNYTDVSIINKFENNCFLDVSKNKTILFNYLYSEENLYYLKKKTTLNINILRLVKFKSIFMNVPAVYHFLQNMQYSKSKKYIKINIKKVKNLNFRNSSKVKYRRYKSCLNRLSFNDIQFMGIKNNFYTCFWFKKKLLFFRKKLHMYNKYKKNKLLYKKVIIKLKVSYNEETNPKPCPTLKYNPLHKRTIKKYYKLNKKYKYIKKILKKKTHRKVVFKAAKVKRFRKIILKNKSQLKKKIIFKKKFKKLKKKWLLKIKKSKNVIGNNKSLKYLSHKFIKFLIIKKRLKNIKGNGIISRQPSLGFYLYFYWYRISNFYKKNLKKFKKIMQLPWTPNYIFWKTKLFNSKATHVYEKRKFRQFAKRQYPYIWYKVKHRKFPLKRRKKDWALDMNKAYVTIYNTNIKKLTFFDSSIVYFKYLSSGCKSKLYFTQKQFTDKIVQQIIDSEYYSHPTYPPTQSQSRDYLFYKTKFPFKKILKKIFRTSQLGYIFYSSSVSHFKHTINKRVNSVSQLFLHKTYLRENCYNLKNMISSENFFLYQFSKKLKLYAKYSRVFFEKLTITNKKNKNLSPHLYKNMSNSGRLYRIASLSFGHIQALSNNKLYNYHSYLDDSQLFYKNINYIDIYSYKTKINLFNRNINNYSSYRIKRIQISKYLEIYYGVTLSENMKNNYRKVAKNNKIIQLTKYNRIDKNIYISDRIVNFLNKKNVHNVFVNSIPNYIKKNLWIMNSVEISINKLKEYHTNL